MTVEKHDQNVTHHYTVHYPAHPERNSDPHYKDFNHYRKQTKATAKCSVGDHRNDFSECTLDKRVDLKWLEVDYPGISDPDTIGAWVESANNLVWLCEFHHRGFGGAHTASASDYEAEKYVRGLMYTEPDPKAVQVRLPNPPETII